MFTSFQIFFCQQQIEEMVDGVQRDVFRGTQEGRFGFLIAYRLDAAVPLHIVDAEDGLVEGQRHRDGHELAGFVSAELAQVVQ